MKGNFTEVKPLRYWVQHILPLVYDDSLSYMELLGKVINILNEVVNNNNMLPDYIMELIKDYISSGEFEKVLADVLANYMLNVKFPPAGLKPATGDGSADDTEAIQGCIDYAYNNGGMSVYFPSGSYLTQPLTLRDKATLFGQDRYTTRLVMKGGATTAMFTGDVDELTLTGLGFDGNMDIQVNNVNLFTISVNSAIITNCLLTDGYDLLNITVNDDLQLNDIIFKHAVENALVLKGAGIVQGNNLIFKSVSALVGKNFVVMDVSKSILEQLKCYGASPNAVLINGSNNVIKMWNEQSLKAYTDNGNNNTVEVYTQSEQKKLTGFKTTNVSGDLTETVGGNKTESITGNKGINVHDLTETVTGNYTKTVTGDISESASNFKLVIQLAYELTANRLTEQLTSKEVNATNSTENLGNKTETITGEKEVNANGLMENIATEKHVIAGSVTENITGDKHVNVANSIETVQGDKTVTAGDISETAVNKTVHITKDNTEQIDGTRTEVCAGNKNENVAGTYSGKFGNATFETKTSSWPVKFPNKTVDLVNIHKPVIRTVRDYGAKGDSVTDDTVAIKACIEAESIIYFPAGTYRVTDTLTLDNKRMVGENKSSTFLRMDGNKTLINAGSRTQINDITLGFYNADGAGYGEKIALNCMGSKYALQRTSISNVNIWICGTAIKSGSEPFFSVNFDTMEITEFTYAAVQINTPDSTQSAFRNLYITSTKKPDYMFIVYTRISSIYIENLNLEHTVPKNDPFILNGYLTAYINGLQFEGITLTQNVGLISLNGKYTVIDRLTNIFNTLDPNSEYGIMMHIGKCNEFGDFTANDMVLLNQSSTIIINSYTQWGFNFNGKALTFANRVETEPGLNLYINGFGGVAYSSEDIAKYDIFVQAPDSTNAFKNVNPHYGATVPTKFITKSQLFYDTADNKFKYYNGSAWIALQNEQA